MNAFIVAVCAAAGFAGWLTVCYFAGMRRGTGQAAVADGYWAADGGLEGIVRDGLAVADGIPVDMPPRDRGSHNCPVCTGEAETCVELGHEWVPCLGCGEDMRPAWKICLDCGTPLPAGT
jgi:hypothetical protein